MITPVPQKTQKAKYADRPPHAAFTLVEILIVVSILGILAAIVLPEFQNHQQHAKEAAAKENLRTLRQAIEIVTSNLAEIQYEIPDNPFNKKNTIEPVFGDLPPEPTGEHGYLYHPPTKTIRLDWPGTDSQGTRFYDY